MKLASEERSASADHAPVLDLQGFLTREQHRIHLVGVAGSGMSGLAGLLIELGHAVSGSDKVTSTDTERLQRLGLRFHKHHRPGHAETGELVLFSPATTGDVPPSVQAREAGPPLLRRGERLPAILRAEPGVVNVGLHG